MRFKANNHRKKQRVKEGFTNDKTLAISKKYYELRKKLLMCECNRCQRTIRLSSTEVGTFCGECMKQGIYSKYVLADFKIDRSNQKINA
ncbi:hypothetical protein [Paenibacillus taichungensis]|uniref:hypothetical protein n=1 Tax=Paenibacillus taichungensis TaxID=484184 RepID=UPI0039A2D16A